MFQNMARFYVMSDFESKSEVLWNVSEYGTFLRHDRFSVQVRGPLECFRIWHVFTVKRL